MSERVHVVPSLRSITNRRIQQIAPSPTMALTAKAKELKSRGKPVISLAAGEPDFPMPEIAHDAVKKALKDNFTRYTPASGALDLKEGIRQKALGRGIKVENKNIAVSCGAKHSLYNLLQVLVGPDDEVLIPSPYWVSYPEMIKLAGGKIVIAETSENQFLMTRKVIEKALTPKTRIIILNSPSNPTGAVLNEAELERIARLVVERNLYVLTDEIYEYYVYDGVKQHSIASFIDNFMDHVAIVSGASKSYAMTGLRIGYTIAREDVIKAMSVLQDHSSSNPATLSQKAALACLGLDKSFEEKLKKDFEKKRDIMLELLGSTKGLKVFKPQGAFYCFVSVEGTGLSPDTFSKRLLEEKFVATIPGEGFGSKTHVRMSFAASIQDIQEGCRRISEWTQSL